MLSMGANKLLCSLLGLLALIGLTAGRSIIQHNFRENLYGADLRRNPFISYTQDEPDVYNAENVVPYPYNSLTRSRPKEQTTPMGIHLKIEIPAIKVELVSNEAQRNLLPFSMPSYYKTPRYNPFGSMQLPIIRHLTHQDEQRSVKRPENFRFADPDNIPTFLQRPLPPIFDLESLLKSSAVFDADKLVENILSEDIESADNDDDDDDVKYKNAENFQEDEVIEDSSTEDLNEFFEKLFNEFNSSENEDDDEIVIFKNIFEFEKNDEPIDLNSALLLEYMPNQPQSKAPANVDDNEDDDERTTDYFVPKDDASKESAESNEKNDEPIDPNSEVLIEYLPNEPELKVPINMDDIEVNDERTSVYFVPKDDASKESADSNEKNDDPIDPNSEVLIEYLPNEPELKVPINIDDIEVDDEKTSVYFAPKDDVSKESAESNEKNDEPIDPNSEVLIEYLPNEPELKVPINIDDIEVDDERTSVYFVPKDDASKESADSNEKNDDPIDPNSEVLIEYLPNEPELKVPINIDDIEVDDEKTSVYFAPKDDVSKESAESNEKNDEPIDPNSEVLIEYLPNEPELKVPINIDDIEVDDERTSVYFVPKDDASKESAEFNEKNENPIHSIIEMVENLTNEPELEIPVDVDDEEKSNEYKALINEFKSSNDPTKDSTESNENKDEPIDVSPMPSFYENHMAESIKNNEKLESVETSETSTNDDVQPIEAYDDNSTDSYFKNLDIKNLDELIKLLSSEHGTKKELTDVLNEYATDDDTFTASNLNDLEYGYDDFEDWLRKNYSEE